MHAVALPRVVQATTKYVQPYSYTVHTNSICNREYVQKSSTEIKKHIQGPCIYQNWYLFPYILTPCSMNFYSNAFEKINIPSSLQLIFAATSSFQATSMFPVLPDITPTVLCSPCIIICCVLYSEHQPFLQVSSQNILHSIKINCSL